jgi:hypothetical protein
VCSFGVLLYSSRVLLRVLLQKSAQVFRSPTLTPTPTRRQTPTAADELRRPPTPSPTIADGNRRDRRRTPTRIADENGRRIGDE